jgi:hypothetical protein
MEIPMVDVLDISDLPRKQSKRAEKTADIILLRRSHKKIRWREQDLFRTWNQNNWRAVKRAAILWVKEHFEPSTPIATRALLKKVTRRMLKFHIRILKETDARGFIIHIREEFLLLEL